MGQRTSYEPGTFSWADLATTDVAAARSFYGSLFGWDMDGADAGAAGYTICRLGDDAVCGLFAVASEMRASGMPPGWISYVTVTGADAAVTRAQELGGAVIVDAFDVPDAGRMAVLEDPQGAVFAVWQPRARIGAERVNDIGCLCMNDLATGDIVVASPFYEGLFGWRTELPGPGSADPGMALVYRGESLNASISVAEHDQKPHWLPYFAVAATEAAVERVRELGGHVLLEPLEISDGRIAIAADPQGAAFGLFAGEVDP